MWDRSSLHWLCSSVTFSAVAVQDSESGKKRNTSLQGEEYLRRELYIYIELQLILYSYYPHLNRNAVIRQLVGLLKGWKKKKPTPQRAFLTFSSASGNSEIGVMTWEKREQLLEVAHQVHSVISNISLQSGKHGEKLICGLWHVGKSHKCDFFPMASFCTL